LPDAATSLLSKLPDRWEIPMLECARAPLRRSPLLVFGNHPSMLTPFLLAAALERDDLRILAHRYVTTLVPSMASYVLPLEPTHLVSARRRGLATPAHALSLSALRQLDGLVDEAEARRVNRAALDEGVRHVLAGGALAIFPNGGRESGRWYPGLGRLVDALRGSDALLVPVREAGSSNRRVYRLLRGRRRRAPLREPIRFYVGEPIPMRRLVLPADAEAGEIVALLQSVYERTAWTALDRGASLRTSG
jgi:1-acyl-sn-glycerol-3-phosphate acyltransferase